MRTTIRLGTILFALIILGSFGAVPTILTIKNLWTGINVATVAAVILSLLFASGLFTCAWLTILIRIDSNRQTIKFIYPLRFKVYRFNFNDIVGFSYKYLLAKVDYKAIRFKTKAGHTFTVSDFETSNLRELEATCLNTFELKATENFLPLSEEGRKREIESSRKFDIAQAKQIRDMLIIGIFFFIIIIVSNIYKSNGPLSTGKIFFYLITTFILIRMTRKLIKVIGTVKNGA